MSALKRIGLVLVGLLVGYGLSFAISPVRAQRGQTTSGRFETKSSEPLVGGSIQGYYVQDTKAPTCWFVVVANGSSQQIAVAVSPASTVQCAAK